MGRPSASGAIDCMLASEELCRMFVASPLPYRIPQTLKNAPTNDWLHHLKGLSIRIMDHEAWAQSVASAQP